MRRLKTVRRPPIYPKTPGHLPCSSLTHPLPLSSRRPSVSFGGFGLMLGGVLKHLQANGIIIEHQVILYDVLIIRRDSYMRFAAAMSWPAGLPIASH